MEDLNKLLFGVSLADLSEDELVAHISEIRTSRRHITVDRQPKARKTKAEGEKTAKKLSSVAAKINFDNVPEALKLQLLAKLKGM
jgi:hypothetical protein